MTPNWLRTSLRSPHKTFLFKLAGLCFAISSFAIIASAQSTLFNIQNTPSPTTAGNILNAVTATSATDSWAVGFQNENQLNGARTLTMHWDGVAWKTVASPNPGSTQACKNQNTGNVIQAVSAVSASNVWAAGFSFTCNTLLVPMVLHWDGVKWSAVATPKLNTNDNAQLNSIVALAANDIYAVGYQPAKNGAVQTLVEHYDGVSWTVMSSPNPSSTGSFLFGVTAASASDVWAVGSSGDQATTSDQTMVLHYDGVSWKQVASPNPLPKAFLNQNVMLSVTAVSSADITAVGYAQDSANLRTLTLVEHWDGVKWSLVPSANHSNASGTFNILKGVAAVSASDVYAVGYFSDGNTAGGQQQVFVEHFNGTRWSAIASPSKGVAQQLTGTFALPGTGDVWVSGAYSTVGDDPETGLLQVPKTLMLFTNGG